MTAEALRREGYLCDSAPDAPEAARMLSQKEYDLLISDLEMPGNEDMRLIRDVPQIATGLPVILMTAYPTVETAIQSLQLPVIAYLIKPFGVEKLLTETRRAVESSQAQRAVRINHQRIAEWNRALEQIEASMKRTRQAEATPWQTLMDLTLRNITDAATDLRVFAEFTARQHPADAKDEALDTARPLQLLNALRETIAVLEKTRSSFKSKDLGELRRKLEALLETRPD